MYYRFDDWQSLVVDKNTAPPGAWIPKASGKAPGRTNVTF